MSYSPDPLHTAHVRLPGELLELREILAENVHDMWARQRLVEGWVHGPERDDQLRTHPCLVPYDQLPESEKDYDRETAVETLRAVLAHGYRILPPQGTPHAVAKASQAERVLANLRAMLEADGGSDLRSLMACWRATPADCRWHDLELLRHFIERLLEFQEPLLAYDTVCEGLGRWPDDLRLRQLQGMSLARSGATRHANQVFRQLCAEGHTDEETLANLARTHKAMWSMSRGTPHERAQLEAAYDAYVASYETTHGYWSGINVAFLALARGDHSRARDVATQVYEQCTHELQAMYQAGQDVYWLTATLGEAALIRGEIAEAIQWYTRATAVAGRRYGNMASTRCQARELAAQLNVDWSQFAACFPLPAVVVFSSVNCAPSPMLRAACDVQPIAELLCNPLITQRPMLGFSRLSCEADLVFVETVLEWGGDVAVLVDSDPDRVASRDTASHDTASRDGEIAERMRRVLDQAVEVHRLTSRAGVSDVAMQGYAYRVLTGLGEMRARQLGTDSIVVELPQVEDDSLKPWADPVPNASAGAAPRVMALLFADVRGFSRLHEAQVLTFTREFLGRVAMLIRSSGMPPVTRHTWGDGLFLTFERIVDAGMFALSLAELSESTDWQELGLPGDLSIRIGLHAGPVHECFDPVAERPIFCGIHVSHAARIEPIAPPGHVYASEPFAALAAGENIRGFVCEYVGRTPLAKDFGLFSTYHVRRGAPEHV